MRLSSVSEVSFSMLPERITEDANPEDIQLGFASRIHPDVENNTFELVFGVQYVLNGEVVLECNYRFIFDVKDLVQFIVFTENQGVTVNHLMPHFLSVAVGTMRGILVVKTAGTNFSKYPLPMIDVNKLNADLSTRKR